MEKQSVTFDFNSKSNGRMIHGPHSRNQRDKFGNQKTIWEIKRTNFGNKKKLRNQKDKYWKSKNHSTYQTDKGRIHHIIILVILLEHCKKPNAKVSRKFCDTV